MTKKTAALIFATLISTSVVGATVANAEYCPPNCYYKKVWKWKSYKVWTDYGPVWKKKKVWYKKLVCY